MSKNMRRILLVMFCLAVAWSLAGLTAYGNDWDKATARTPVSGQVLVHQKVDTQVGDTYWVQSITTPSPANGLVDIHDSAPTTDRWNYAAVEIVAAH